jgi:hypothetical protein
MPEYKQTLIYCILAIPEEIMISVKTWRPAGKVDPQV